MTLGIELLLAADIRVAATGTRFTQLEGGRPDSRGASGALVQKSALQ
jgi:enoyl-CoA hydratase/carnithine racemase